MHCLTAVCRFQITTIIIIVSTSRTDTFQPGLRSFPGRGERLILGGAAAHADLDGGRHEGTVAEAGRRVIGGRRRQDRGRLGGCRRVVPSGTTDVRDADEPNRRRTLGFLDEVDTSVDVL